MEALGGGRLSGTVGCGAVRGRRAERLSGHEGAGKGFLGRLEPHICLGLGAVARTQPRSLGEIGSRK